MTLLESLRCEIEERIRVEEEAGAVLSSTRSQVVRINDMIRKHAELSNCKSLQRLMLALLQTSNDVGTVITNQSIHIARLQGDLSHAAEHCNKMRSQRISSIEMYSKVQLRLFAATSSQRNGKGMKFVIEKTILTPPNYSLKFTK
jgi:hypothetical protein